jgi:hypothetical protein
MDVTGWRQPLRCKGHPDDEKTITKLDSIVNLIAK